MTPGEAMFDHVAPVSLTHFTATCTLISYHGSSGKVLTVYSLPDNRRA